ncbi:MAG: chromosome segregation protein SMC [Kiritimatiellae bacterium]|nr:chromosome segregation protein SMC [Kiritimatiellia bacterium]
MSGFKSFADKTKLVFEPGLVAIVGPNGCGKSNVSDAIRWVLGEQRPSALRGSKMLDVIFNGTDSRKPMSMCEVNITFADCEGTLSTEFNEVTVTRRVFRTGDSGYFINKAPCRLKDIQRLFMGTGIGTTSYSVMAQGQIDAILSSRPEDRRTIFEEAAGITKYKADRKEAIRKLDQTEANLARVTDVLRELRRQIGSLERQVAKAEKFKRLKAELRTLDFFAVRGDVAALDARLAEIGEELSAAVAREGEAQDEVARREGETAAMRAEIAEREAEINDCAETAAQDAARLEHAKDMIGIGEQRIADYRAWADRDSKESSEMRTQLVQLEGQVESLGEDVRRLDMEVLAAREERETVQSRTEEERAAIEGMRQDLQARRSGEMERERRVAFLQNRLVAMDAKQRAADIQRERLTGERDKIKADAEALAEAQATLEGVVDTLRDKDDEAASSVASAERGLEETRATISAGREEIARIRSRISASRAKIALLRDQEKHAESFGEGARLLLDPENPLGAPQGSVLGTLAGCLTAPREYRAALAATLGAWVDAIVVGGGAAREIASILSSRGAPARLVASDGAGAGDAPPESDPALSALTPLVDVVGFSADFAARGARLLSRVYVAPALGDVPREIPRGATVVTLSGEVFSSDGRCEVWRDEAGMNPFSRHMEIEDGEALVASEEEHLVELEDEAEEAERRASAIAAALSGARAALDEVRRQLSQKEGELAHVEADARRSAQRLEAVSAELHLAAARTQEAERERDGVKDEMTGLIAGRDDALRGIEEAQKSLTEREAEFNEFNRFLTEARVREANRVQELNQANGKIAIFRNRIDEIKRSLEGRTKGMQSYDENIAKLTGQIEETRAKLGPMRIAAEESRARLDGLKALRADRSRDLQRAEESLAAVRQSLDAVRSRHGALDVEKTEVAMRRQNRIERVQQEYAVPQEEILASPLPEWPDGEPTIEAARARIGELNASISALGPVNLVALEEYDELQKRFKLESEQEEDLKKAKGELVELIRVINGKSAEMFAETFRQANSNFETMFTKLFNGGTAKLSVIENPEDPLECGVEIIARPPGKRPQSISLLSGGERTMTAVSLLFAIYMIKPSPFCLLDELDAALDDSNIGRFVQALKDFLVQSQFLIITHNQHTIENSGIVYGVTMPERGVSKIVSMRMPK